MDLGVVLFFVFVLVLPFLVILAIVIYKIGDKKNKQIKRKKQKGNVQVAKKKSTNPSKSPFRPGSIGAVNAEIGYDVRDLWMAGLRQGEESQYSKEAIQNFAHGKISLEELRNGKERPDDA